MCNPHVDLGTVVRNQLMLEEFHIAYYYNECFSMLNESKCVKHLHLVMTGLTFTVFKVPAHPWLES